MQGPQDHVEHAAAVPPVLALRRLIFGHRVTRIITIAAQLGLADHLADGPKRADELAALVQADAPTLYRLLRALVSVGVFSEIESGGFVLTPLADGCELVAGDFFSFVAQQLEHTPVGLSRTAWPDD